MQSNTFLFFSRSLSHTAKIINFHFRFIFIFAIASGQYARAPLYLFNLENHSHRERLFALPTMDEFFEIAKKH
jgi:hypothetical protein